MQLHTLHVGSSGSEWTYNISVTVIFYKCIRILKDVHLTKLGGHIDAGKDDICLTIRIPKILQHLSDNCLYQRDWNNIFRILKSCFLCLIYEICCMILILHIYVITWIRLSIFLNLARDYLVTKYLYLQCTRSTSWYRHWSVFAFSKK